MKNGSHRTTSLFVAGTLMILVAFQFGVGFQKSSVSASDVRADLVSVGPQVYPLPEPEALLLAVVDLPPDDEDETDLDRCAQRGKVLICHVPPGNPENPQTLCVSQSAAEWHFREHDGDYAGACRPPTPTPTTVPEPTVTPTPSPTPTETPEPASTPIPTVAASPLPTDTATPQPGITPALRELQVNVKAPEPQNGAWGQTLYYTFTVTNTGNARDTYALALTSEHAFVTSAIQANATLDPAERRAFTVAVELPLTGDVRSDRLTLTATSRTYADVTDADTVTTTLASPQPKVLFTKTADHTSLVPGAQIVYTIAYRNTGNIPLLNAVITDRLPQELQFVESSLVGDVVDQQTLRFDLPPVISQDQGGALTITARVNPDSAFRGQLTNTATFTAENLPDPVSASSRATIEVPELRIEKTVNKSEASVGDIVLYTITVTNSGSGAARNASVLDALPSVMRYVPGSSAINGQIAADPELHGAQELRWPLGTLDPGDQAILRYQTTILADAKSGVYRNKASVAAEDSSGQTILAGPVKTKVRVARGGARLSAEIEGSVFLDRNGNGAWDAGEPGLPNIAIRFIRGRLVKNSNEDGEFFFGEVPPGDQVFALDETTLQPGYRLTTEATVLLSLAEGDVGYVEFGVQSELGAIVGSVYHDVNANDRRDPGEPGVAGARLDIDNAVFFITNADGQITATHFPAGTHTVALKESALPDKFQAPQAASITITLLPGSNASAEFGLTLRPGRLVGQVFADLNVNGTPDSQKSGVSGIVLQLQNGDIYQATSDNGGNYLIDALAPGAYTARLHLASLPAETRVVGESTRPIVIAPGQETRIDWGLVTFSEPLSEVTATPTATPTSPISTPTASTVTPTTSTVTPTMTAMPEAAFCVYTVQSGDTLARIAGRLTGQSANYIPIMASNQLTSDRIQVGATLNIPQELLLPEYQTCNFEPVGSAEGRVYYDRNANGRYDQGVDLPIPGVTVNIRSDIKTTVTDENGYYRFDNMEPGAHVVWIDPQTLPAPYTPLGDQPIIKIVVQPGGTAATAVADFIVLKASIYEEGVVEGVVCFDVNGNNDCDPGEPGIVGVTVYDPPAINVGNISITQVDPAGNNTPINLCESVTFRVTIPNEGADAAINVVVQNSMPAAAGFTNLDGSPATQTQTIPSIPPGENRSVDFTYRATCHAIAGDNTTVINFTDAFGTIYPPIHPDVRHYTVAPGAITLTKVATAITYKGHATPTLIPETSEPKAELGDVITWRIRVASTGYGNVKNAEVTETLQAGLSLVGGTLSFNKTTDPLLCPTCADLADIAVGDSVDLTYQTEVIACAGFQTDASAIWGCGSGACLPAVTAQASVNFVTKFPYLEYTPQDVAMTVPYCATGSVTRDRILTITNTGNGEARNAVIDVVNIDPLGDPLPVTVLSSNPADVTYSGSRFILPAIIAPGETVTINYRVNYDLPTEINWCAAGTINESEQFTWEPTYVDECAHEFKPPIYFQQNAYSITMDAAQPKPQVSVSKSCTVGGQNISPIFSLATVTQTVICNVTVTYTGPTSCGTSGTVSPLAASDNYPDQWNLVSTVPDATTPALAPSPHPSAYDDTGTSVAWTIPAAEVSDGRTFRYVQTFTIPAIGDADACSSCGNLWENTFSVSGADCCQACPISASVTVATNIECPDPTGIGLTSDRTVSPENAEVCQETMTFTNRYEFTGARWNNIPWAGNVIFTEENANALELDGDVEVSFNGGGTFCNLPASAYTDNTPGGTLRVTNFTDTLCGTSGNIGAGTVLIIRYALRPTVNSDPQCGNSFPFVDYGNLEVLDTSGGALPPGEFCPGSGDGSVIVRDANNLTTQGSQMAVDIAWAQPTTLVGACGEYDATITITKNSDAPAYDVSLFLENVPYESLTVTGCSPFAPTNQADCKTVQAAPATPFGTGYVWNYADLFDGVAGQTATLNIHVQGRCLSDPNLRVRLGYNDGCHDVVTPANADPASRSCPVREDAVSGIIREPNIVVSKFPELVYAEWDAGSDSMAPAEWTITVLNSGAGDAFHVEVVETLGGDLSYPVGGVEPPVLSEWTDNLGNPLDPAVDGNITRDVLSTQQVMYTIDRIPAGKSRKLTFRADIQGCLDTSNDVTARVRCLDMDPADSTTWCDWDDGQSAVQFPPTDLRVATSMDEASLCSPTTITISALNTGLTPVYNVDLREALPADLWYQINSAEYRLNGAGVWSGAGSTEPAITPAQVFPLPVGQQHNLLWSYAAFPFLERLDPQEKVEIRFNAIVFCNFTEADIVFQASFDKCGSSTRGDTDPAIFTISPDKPNIFITKEFEETANTCEVPVSWLVTITNHPNAISGQTGPAQYIWIQDTWGSEFDPATVKLEQIDAAGNSLGEVSDTLISGNSIYWEIFDMPVTDPNNPNDPNIKRFRLSAAFHQGACDGTLDNNLNAVVRCLNPLVLAPETIPVATTAKDGCDIPPAPFASATSDPEVPELAVDLDIAHLDACAENAPIRLVFTNTAEVASLYNLDLDILLPEGVTVNTATTQILVNGAAPAQAPVIEMVETRQRLRFFNGDTSAPNLPTLLPANPAETNEVVITFNVDTECDADGLFDFDVRFEDCCNVQHTQGFEPLDPNWRLPNLAVNVVAASGPFECGENVTWTIEVSNPESPDGIANTIPVEMVRVTDTYGIGLTFVSLTGIVPTANPLIIHTPADPGVPSDGTIVWEIANLGVNETRRYTLTTTLGSGGTCSDPAERRNDVEAVWSCTTHGGNADEDPTTNEAFCTAGTRDGVDFVNVTPSAIADATVSPSNVPLCAVNTYVDVDITIPADSNTVYNLEATITLPDDPINGALQFHNTGVLSNLQISVLDGNDALVTGLAKPAVADFPANGSSVISFNDNADRLNSNTFILANSVTPHPVNGTTIRVRFALSSSCYVSGNIDIDLEFKDCCGNVHCLRDPLTGACTVASNPIDSGEPILTGSVTRSASTPSDVDCGDQIQYDIVVTNTGNAVATYAIIEAELGEWMSYSSSTVPTMSGGSGDSSEPCAAELPNGLVRWEFTELLPGESWQTTLTVDFDSPGAGATCDLPDRQIRLSTSYGCPTDITNWTFDDDACVTNEDSGICTRTVVDADIDTEPQPDLEITSATPTLACDAGGATGQLSVGIRNNRNGPNLDDFDITVTEPTLGAWSKTITYTGTLTAAGTADDTDTVIIPLDNLPFDCAACQEFNFVVTIDSDTDICECDETNNEFVVPAYEPCVSIGDLAWHDINGDGLQNEALTDGMNGITVNLYMDSNGNGNAEPGAGNDGVALLTTTTVTNAGVWGYYLFDNLLPGDYFVEFALSTIPTGYIVTRQDQGANDGLDSDINRTTGLTPVTSLDYPTDRPDPTWDVGFFHPVSIGNYVWLDSNANGLQDETNTGIPGVLVQLLHAGTLLPVEIDANGASMSSTMLTDANGIYVFANLFPGDYVVHIPLENWADTWTHGGHPPFGSNGDYAGALGSPGPGDDDQDNTDDNGNNDGILARTNGVFSVPISLLSGQEPTGDGDPAPDSMSDRSGDWTIDFGFYQTVSVGNRVWYDNNADGTQDAGEPGIDGVTVQLQWWNGTDWTDALEVDGTTTVPAQTTSGGGYYLFDNLPPGDYRVLIPQTNWTGGVFSPGQPYAGALGSPNWGGDSGVPPAPATYADDNGNNDGNAAWNGVQSTTIELRSYTEPTSEDSQEVAAGDNNRDLTVDFGFYTYDFGDLPDSSIPNTPNYPTRLVDTGAHHVIDRNADGTPRTFLGAGVDAEFDGRSGIGADGDDTLDGSDDEDGVEFLTAIMPNRPYQIRVTSTPGAILNAWIDFNNDGTLETRLADNVMIPAGGELLIEGTAPDVIGTSVYSRFRVTTETGQGGDSPSGLATSGEVEDYVLMSLGDFVWRDDGGGTVTNGNNGRFDAGETGIADVIVQLYRQTGTGPVLWGETQTEADGRYLFTGLEPGNYYIHIPKENFEDSGDPLHLHFSTIGNEGDDDLNETVTAGNSDNGIDSNSPSTTGISSAIITLALGGEPTNDGDTDANSNRAIDFGFYRPVALGNFVWDDNGNGGGMPNDGIVNGSEQTQGLAGVTVQLYWDSNNNGIAEPGIDTLIATTVTDPTGFYLFDMLVEGRYFVHIPESQFASGGVLEDYISSLPQGVDDPNDDDADENGQNNANPASGGISSTIINLQAGTEPPGEAGQGGYAGWLSDASVNLTVDFGLLQPVSLGNRVWLDLNGDGVQDANEIGINGVTVVLTDADGNDVHDVNGNLVNPVVTSSIGGNDGYYLFENLLPGRYIVSIPLSNWETIGVFAPGQPYEGAVGSPGNGGNNHNDTDDNGNNDGTAARTSGVQSNVIDLRADLEPTSEDGDSDTDLTIDFGFFQPVSVGNFIWLDANANGQWDSGELPIQDLTVQLFTAAGDPVIDVDGNTVDAVETDANGLYNFINLRPGTYYVQIPALNWTQAGKPFSSTGTYAGAYGSPGQVADSANDPDNNRDHGDNDGILAVNTGVRSVEITLTSRGEPVGEDAQDTAGINVSGVPNSSDLRVDFGFYRPASLGDTVWFDQNANGIQDTGEIGIQGVTVTLNGTDGAGNLVTRTATTDENGKYLFDDLMPGDYSVTFTPPSGYVLSPQDRGGDDEKDSDADPATGQTIVTTLVSGENDLSWDAGLYQPVRIGNLVWHDANDNGIYEPLLSETGIDGVEVTLTGTDGAGNAVSLTTTTAGGGFYLFDNLAPGTYTVSIPTPPAGYPASSTDTDTHDNGQDNDDNGSQAIVGGATNSPPITLTSHQEPPEAVDGDDWNGDLTIDFGFYAPVNLGNLIWHDANDNGLVDGGESGIDGLEIRLFRAGDDPLTATPVQTDVTSGGGYYEFTDLRPGQYVVYIPNPLANYPTSSTITNGNDDGIDNDDNGIQSTSGGATQSPIITLTSNGEVTNDGDGNNGDLTVDFGFFHPISVGNRVWFDINANGVQDVDEPGIPGVRVELYLSDGVTKATDITGAEVPALTTLADGAYAFTNLPPGDYIVRIPESNWTSGVFSPTGAYANALGSPNTADSAGDNGNDTDDNGYQDGENAWNGVQSPVINLQSQAEINDGDADNNNNPSVDFGFYRHDFGDLPDAYGTTLTAVGFPNGGARHAIDGVTYLGSRVDEELTGAPTDTALGDDNNVGRPDDEDGVEFLDPIMPSQPGQPYQYQIKVTASVAGYLNAWIDFDGLGFGADDKLLPEGFATADNILLQAGENILTFTAPESATSFATTLYSRFRFTKNADDGGVTPTGLARSGEVEDYALMSLGNLVWFDDGNGTLANANNGIRDAGELPVENVELQLRNSSNVVIATTRTDSGGNYLFTGLMPSHYTVHIPNSNFQTGGALFGYVSTLDKTTDKTTPDFTNPNTNVDQNADENGIDSLTLEETILQGVTSGTITLSLGTEPTNELDDAIGDANSNLTLDFGVIPYPILHVEKTANTTRIQPCETTDNPNTPETEPLTFTIRLSNLGRDHAAMWLAQVIETLPLGWELLASEITPAALNRAPTQTANADGSTTLIWDFTPMMFIPQDGEIVIDVQVIVNSNTLPDVCEAGYQFVNSVEVVAYDHRDRRLLLDPTSEPTADAVFVDCPALYVVTTAEPTGDVEPCVDITYTITLENTGGLASTLEDIRVNDALPANFQVTSMAVTLDGAELSEGEQYAAYFMIDPDVPTTQPYAGVPFEGPATLEWFFGENSPDGQTLPNFISLPPGQVIVITVIGQFTENACGTTYTPTIIASAGADLCGLPKQPTTDSILQLPTTTIVCPTVSLTKSAGAPAFALPGQPVRYTLEAVNNGPASSYLYDVVITDTLPSGWTVVSTTATGASLASGPAPGSAGELAWAFAGPALAGGQRATITLDIAADVSICGQAAFCNAAAFRGRTNCGTDVMAATIVPPPCVTVLCPTPTPSALPPEPTAAASPTPTPTPPPVIEPDGERFGKRREEVGLRKPCTVVPAELEKPWFITDIAMYAASEMHHTSQPFIQWSEANGLAVERTLLTPTGVREFGAEILEFSVNNIHSVISNAGIGLHLKNAPLIAAAASAAELEPKAYVDQLLQHFAERANLRMIPDNVYPVFIEYAEGDPRYITARNVNDWLTLQWNTQSFNTHLIPSAFGQTLLRQTLLMEEFLATNHQEDGTSALDGDFTGISDVKGFLGLLTAEEVVNKLWFMRHALLHERADQPGRPYFPYQSVAEADAAETLRVTVVDEHSRLFDQVSLLWGLSEIMLLTDASASATYRQAFETARMFPGQASRTGSAEMVHTLAQELAAVVFATLQNFHTVSGVEGLVEVFPGACDAQTCTYTLNTTYLGLSVPALARYYQAMPNDPDTQNRILALVQQVADVLAQQVTDAENQGIPETISIRLTGDTSEITADDNSRTLTAQMTAIRGLLAAAQLTGGDAYRAQALALYESVEARFWNDDLGIYNDRQTRSAYRYTPLTLGATVGALRELVYAADSSLQAVQITNRLRTFTRQIAKYAGLQLSELGGGAGQDFLIPVGGLSAIRPAQQFQSPFGLAPVFNAEVRLNREAILALHAKRPTDACDQARASLRSAYYFTDIGMYAASELARSQAALFRTLAERGLSPAGAQNRNPELFEPVAGDATGAKARDFSDYNLLHVLTKSALGVGLPYGPVIVREAEAHQMEPDVYLETLLQHYAELTGLEAVPANLAPIFLAFEGGVPEIEDQERWYASNMDRSVIPSAIGQTLVRQVLWLREVLAIRHTAQNRISPDGQYLGRNAEEGFLGLLIAQEVANTVAVLDELLQVRIPEASRVTTPSGFYIPHRFEIDFDGDRPAAFTVKDADSYLFDQASLLWGLSELIGLLRDPQIDVFGPGKLIDGDYAALTDRLMRRALHNLEALHWDAAQQTFVDRRILAPQSIEENAAVISTHNAAFAIMALDSVARHVADPTIQAQARTLLRQQAGFMARVLWRADDGAVANGATLTGDVGQSGNAKPFSGLKTLLAQTAAIRSFVIAYSVSGDSAYLKQAKQTFRFLEATFWNESLQVYRSAIGGSQAQYTPLNAGMTVGALQALAVVSDAETLSAITDHLSKFFEQIIERIGLQLSEQRQFLEASGGIKLLAPVIAADLVIQPLGSAVDVEVPQAGSTLIYVIEFTEATLQCDASAASVEDILPEGLTFIRSVPVPIAYDGQVIRWSVSDLVPDDDGVYRVRLEVQVDPSGFAHLGALAGIAAEWLAGDRPWQINNCAQLSCQVPGEAGQVRYSDCVGTAIQRPLIGLEKSLRSITAEPGREAQFELVVTNLSEVTAYTVTLEDRMPAGFIYVEDSARSLDTVLISLDDHDPLVWVLEDLAPRQSLRLTYRVFIDPALPDEVYTTTVTAHALDRAGFPFESNEFGYDFRVERALLIDVKQQLARPAGVSQVLSGNTFTVVTNLDNVGSDALQEGALLVTLPQGVEYVAGSSRLNNTALPDPERANAEFRWRIGELPVKGQAVLQFTVRSQEPLPENPEIETRLEGLSATGNAYQSKPYRLELTPAP